MVLKTPVLGDVGSMDGNRRVDGTAEEEAKTKAQKKRKFEDEDVLLYVEGVDCSATVNSRALKANGRRVKDVLGIMEYRHKIFV